MQLSFLLPKATSSQVASDDWEFIENLFNPEDDDERVDVSKLQSPSKNLLSGEVQIVFAHQESLLSKEGRELMKGEVCQRNVAATTSLKDVA